jgi:hypothetical protein
MLHGGVLATDELKREPAIGFTLTRSGAAASAGGCS